MDLSLIISRTHSLYALISSTLSLSFKTIGSTAILCLLFDVAIVFLSGGVPYWYYHFAHPRFSHDTALCENASNTIVNYEEHWSNRIRQISKVWKTHQLIVGAVLALVDFRHTT